MKRKIYKLLSGAKQSLLALALVVSVTAHSQMSYTLTYTGAMQTLALSSGLWGIECWGANGGSITAVGGGGVGGYSKGEITLSSAQTINIFVGGKGKEASGLLSGAPGAGGWNGGGGGTQIGCTGAGGGGATDVRVGGIAATDRVIVAGGGGGAAGYYTQTPNLLIAAGGNGGGVTAANGNTITSGGVITVGGGGAGASGASPGVASVATSNGSATGGGGGANSANGASIGGNGTGGGPGGAAGVSGGGSTGSAAGGGGGYAGGAGGVQTNNGAAAGGGGSGYIGGVTNGITTGSTQPGFVPNPDISGDGYVIIKELCNIGLTATKNPICVGESVTLSTGALGGIFWAHNGSTSPSVTVSPTSSTAYTVSGQGVNSCTTSLVVTITVNPLPNLSAVVVPSVLCVGKTATITASGANTYTWTTLSSTGVTATVNPAATTSYNYSGTSQFGCVNSTVVSVNVNTNSVSITPNTTICEGQSITLTAGNALTYTWSTGNNFPSTPVAPITNTTYMVSGTDIYNCVTSNVVNITVDNKPNVSASASKNTICKGESVNLMASGASTYTWSGTAGTGAQVTINPPVDVVYTYTVIGTASNGCTNTAVVAVTVSRCSGLDKLNGDATASRVYPNPASSEVTVETGNALPNTIEVMDLTGRTVMFVAVKEQITQLSLDQLSNGVYYFKIRSAENVEVIRVIKNN